MSKATYNPFAFYEERVASAAAKLGFSKALVKKLTTPDRVIEKEITVETSRGKKTFPAYRVQFNNARGPYKGGIRFHPGADLAEVKALSAGMALKCAAVGIPLGGGKGGVTFDPKEYTADDIEKISRAWMRAMAEHIGVDRDIPAPDVYTTPEIMGVMLDEYEKAVGHSEPGVITGKPIVLGGSEGRGTATAQGGVYVLLELLKTLKRKPKKLTVAIQGFGNAGAHIATLLHREGMKIVGLSDSKGGIFSEKGFDPSEVEQQKRKGGSLSSAIKKGVGSVITNEELLELPVDILIPAALDNQITSTNADNIKAKIVLELANGPTTPEADEILNRKGILVVPDILANAGGVTVSYFEWVQNRQQFYWTEREVLERLKPVMVRAATDCFTRAKKEKLSFREALYRIALQRIAEAEVARGLHD